MYSKILVPYDGSTHAKHALQAALNLSACDTDAEVTILHITSPIDFQDPTFVAAAQMAGIVALNDEETRRAQAELIAAEKERVMTETAEYVKDATQGITYSVVSGKPAETIVAEVERGKYQLIVMGCRGLGALRGALGSVSYAVLRSVDIPVLAVK